MMSVWRKRKLRRLIQDSTKKLSKPQLPPEYQDLVDPVHSTQFRKIWFRIVFACFLICCYQITERILYYFTYPLAVNIQIDNRVQQLKFPPFAACSLETDYLAKLLEDQVKYDPLACFGPWIKMWDENDVDFNKVWHFKNKSNLLEKITYENDIVQTPVTTSIKIKLWGQCTNVHINEAFGGKKSTFKIAMSFLPGKMCKPRASVVTVSAKMESSMLIYLTSGYLYNLKVSFRSYQFGSTSQRPCVTEEEFEVCYKNCIIKRLSEAATCRLPFFDPRIKLPVCNVSNKEEAKNSFYRAMQTILIPRVFSSCNCLQTCSELGMTFWSDPLQINPSNTVVKLSVDNLIVSLTQKRAYDLISLLADIGGNLSLFMGLSLLSIVDILQRVIEFSTRRDKKAKLNRIEALVLKMDTDRKAQVIQSGINYLWIITLILCTSLTIFMIQERALYYLKIPTRNIVELDYQKDVAFPSLTVCGENLKLSHYKKQYIKQKSSNITDWCDVELLDLYMTKSKFTLKFLWENTKLDPLRNDLNALMESLHLVSVNVTQTIVSTHLGNCDHYKFGETEYSGFFTMHPVPFVYFDKVPIYDCPNAMYKVFVSDYDSSDYEKYDLLSTIDAPVHGTTVNDVHMRVFRRLNTQINPCINNSDRKKCKRSCLIEQIQRSELCRLPFLEDIIDNTLPCNSTSAAKKSLKTFVLIYSNLTKSCPCHRLCDEIGFNINSYAQLQNIDQPFIILFLMFTNLVEHIIEVRQYTLIAFFCDIGNSFGLAMGMCILSFVRYSRRIISWMQSKV